MKETHLKVRESISKSFVQIVKDLLSAPLRLTILPDDTATRLGLTSLEEERIRAVWPYIQGRLLDIGAGRNRLVQRYGNGIGVDVHDWGGGALIVENSANLPFPDESFDTVTFLASLNHIPYREEVLREAYRLLKPGGRLIVTMINPFLGWIGHRIFWWYDPDQRERGITPGEVWGMWPYEVENLLTRTGFVLCLHKRFVYGLNHLFVGIKETS